MHLRRVVTIENTEAKSTILADGPVPRSTAFQHVPGFVTSLLWATNAQATVPTEQCDVAFNTCSWVPQAGGTRLMVITFPPDSIYQAAEFNPVAAGAEYAAVLPGLAERFEPDNSGMHTTDTIDYGVVLEGNIVLELDKGQQIGFGKHDVIVQQGTRHAWRNPGSEPATVLFVMVGALR